MFLEDVDTTGYETILLDRDGTINAQRLGDYVKSWEEFEFLPNVKGAIAQIAENAKHIFIVTNQRGVGKGKMTEGALISLHAKMIKEIEHSGGRIDKIYYSTAVDDKDYNRKPNIGMWSQIRKDFSDVKPETTMMIGDSNSDMEFAINCGIRGVIVEKRMVKNCTNG